MFICHYNLGTCIIAQQEGVDYDCAPDGSFEPLQCQPDVEGLMRCVCVQPGDGTPIPGTDVLVENIEDAPDCDQLGKINFCHVFFLYNWENNNYHYDKIGI